MDAPILDVRLTAGILHTRIPKSFGWDTNDVLLLGHAGLELGLDGMHPLALHDFLEAGVAEVVPAPAEPCFTHCLEGFIDEDTTTQTTCGTAIS